MASPRYHLGLVAGAAKDRGKAKARTRALPWPILLVAVVSASGCAESTKVVTPDFTIPSHRLVAEQFTAAFRREDCTVGFIETPELNAASAGNCVFVVTTGLVDAGDGRLIAGIVAHEVAHDVVGHANKRKATADTAEAVRIGTVFIPVVGGLVSWGVAAGGFLALPAYSRSQESDADARAVEILRGWGIRRRWRRWPTRCRRCPTRTATRGGTWTAIPALLGALRRCGC